MQRGSGGSRHSAHEQQPSSRAACSPLCSRGRPRWWRAPPRPRRTSRTGRSGTRRSPARCRAGARLSLNRTSQQTAAIGTWLAEQGGMSACMGRWSGTCPPESSSGPAAAPHRSAPPCPTGQPHSAAHDRPHLPRRHEGRQLRRCCARPRPPLQPQRRAQQPCTRRAPPPRQAGGRRGACSPASARQRTNEQRTHKPAAQHVRAAQALQQLPDRALLLPLRPRRAQRLLRPRLRVRAVATAHPIASHPAARPWQDVFTAPSNTSCVHQNRRRNDRLAWRDKVTRKPCMCTKPHCTSTHWLYSAASETAANERREPRCWSLRDCKTPTIKGAHSRPSARSCRDRARC